MEVKESVLLQRLVDLQDSSQDHFAERMSRQVPNRRCVELESVMTSRISLIMKMSESIEILPDIPLVLAFEMQLEICDAEPEMSRQMMLDCS